MDTGPGLHRLGRHEGSRLPDARTGGGAGLGRGFAVAREDADRPGNGPFPETGPFSRTGPFPATRPFPELPEIPALVDLPEAAGLSDASDEAELPDHLIGSSDGAALPAEVDAADHPFQERELRPARRLRLWQTLPIGAVAILGALMFGFPLAFESNGGGVLIGMLGLLLVAAAAGWGAFAAYRAGYALPGLPRAGSGRRAGWRILLGYTCAGAAVFALALWRVARLRG